MCLCVDMAEFREVFSKARHIAIITGAGVSAESGVPTIRGAEGRWRTWKTQVTLIHTLKKICRTIIFDPEHNKCNKMGIKTPKKVSRHVT